MIQDRGSYSIAWCSVFLFSSLAGTCFYFAYRFWDPITRSLRTGLYVRPKFIFFVVLGTSAVLDLPAQIACISLGGPNFCVWSSASYAVVWSCHLIGTCGQLFAVITPCILWSDIIQQKDGHLWNSASPLDELKIFFRVVFTLYCLQITVVVLSIMIFYKASSSDDFTTNNAVGISTNIAMPILLLVTAIGCLWAGIRLQRHVMRVQLGNATQIKFLVQLNFMMLFITCTYTLRAIYVMSLFGPMPDSYNNLLATRDEVWIPVTQWLPYVLCSFLLVNSMRFKGGGMDKERPSNASSPDSKGSNGLSLHAIVESGLSGTDTDVAALPTHNPITNQPLHHLHLEHQQLQFPRTVSRNDTADVDYLVSITPDREFSRDSTAYNVFDPSRESSVSTSSNTFDYFFTPQAMHSRAPDVNFTMY